MSAVLVTGAAGFIGSRLIELLITTQDCSIVATDVQTNDRIEPLTAHPAVDFRLLDLRDHDALAAAVDGCEYVVHLAALRPAAATANPRAAFEINVAGTYGLIEAAARHGVRRIVYGSSHSVYGAFATKSHYAYREPETPRGRDLAMYGASKLAVEAYLQAFATTGGADYLSLRLGTLYGPRINRDNSLGGMMMDAVDAARSGGRPRVRWAKDALHDLVYVDDAARVLSRALSVDAGDDKAINIVGPALTSTRVFETLVALAGGNPADIEWTGEQVRYQQVSRDLMDAVFPEALTTTLDEGLAAFVDWRVGALPAAGPAAAVDATGSR